MQPTPARDAGEPLLLQVGPQSNSLHALEGTLQNHLGPATCTSKRNSGTQRRDHRPANRANRVPSPYVTLNQSRTMRSGELHYLDHPEIGVLVRIDPVPVPTELAEALETWNPG